MSVVRKFLEAVGDDKVFFIESDYYPLAITVDWFKGADRHGVVNDCYPFLLIKNGPVVKGYWNATKYRALSEEITNRYLSGILDIEGFTKKYHSCAAVLDAFYDAYFSIRGKASEAELLTLLRDADRSFLELTDITLAFDAIDQDIIMRVAKEQGLSVDFRKIWEASEETDFASFELRNDEELLRSFGTSEPERLQYIFGSYTHIPTLDETRTLVSALSCESLEAHVAERTTMLRESAARKAALVAELSEEERRLLTFIDWSGWLRDDRKTHITKYNALAFNIVSDLYRLWNLQPEYAPVSLIYEVLRGRDAVCAQKEELSRRLHRMVTLYHGRDMYEHAHDLSIEEEQLLDAHYLHQHSDTEEGVVRGEVASKGKATGIAHIVTEKAQFTSFREGEILITGMTRPEFVPLMKKAAAIVTDEGGITSHAAIVSRELKKPCVIGTKVATKVFKDGDMVEVDAERGIVRKV